MRRITHIIAGFAAGGAETLALDLASAQAASGDEVTLLGLLDMSAHGRSTAYAEVFGDRARRGGVIPMQLGLRTGRGIALGARKLRASLAAGRADLIHVHMGSALVPLSLLPARRPIVYTLHSAYLPYAPRWLRLFDRVVDHNVAVCAAGEALLAQASRRPVSLVPNGRVPPAGAPVLRPLDPRMIRLLAVGSALKEKDYPTLLAALSQLAPRLAAAGRQFHVGIAGDGALLASLRTAAEQAGLGEHVDFLGARDDVTALMAEADLLISSSATEGLPMAMIEALQAALPIVATAVGGVPDLVIDGSNGVLVPAGRPDLLAEAILTTTADPLRHRAMREAALARAPRFSIAACRAGYEAVYALAQQDAR